VQESITFDDHEPCAFGSNPLLELDELALEPERLPLVDLLRKALTRLRGG
jgi:hypothetical protein